MADELQVYPNPVSGILTIITGTTAPLGYKIITWNGAVVRSGLIEGGSATIDITDFSSGLYQIVTEGEQVLTVRIIKI